MAGEVVWSDRASRDLTNLHDYIAKENPRAATRYVLGLRNACQRLVDYPKSGSMFNAMYRVLVIATILYFTVAIPSGTW